MLNVQKKQIKSIQDYRQNIKLLKYHLKKQKKTNQKLKYESAKIKHHPQTIFNNKNRVYELSQTVKIISDRLKRMGLILEDVFRMADSKYQGEINKEQFMRVVGRLKTDLMDNVFLEMFYNIDTSLNGLISKDQFLQFSIAYGGCSQPKQIRKYQSQIKSKLYNLILKKHGSLTTFLSSIPDPTPIDKLSLILKQLGLNNSQSMIILKTFDPSYSGLTNHKLITSIMSTTKIKTDKQEEGEEEMKNVNDFCVMFRDKKINPIDVFQEADVDGKDGVSPLELERAFIRVFPDRTPFQIRKYISLINFNNDTQISKQQYLNSIRGFYSINQLNKFNQEYIKKHPQKYAKQRKQKQKLGQPTQQSIQSILKQLSNVIQDKKMKKKQAFSFIDFNNNKRIDQNQLLEGLKSLGVPVGIIGRVLLVFDRDGNGSIDIDEWLRILGADEEMSDVALPEDDDDEEQKPKQNKKNKKGDKKPSKSPDTSNKKKPQTKQPIKNNENINLNKKQSSIKKDDSNNKPKDIQKKPSQNNSMIDSKKPSKETKKPQNPIKRAESTKKQQKRQQPTRPQKQFSQDIINNEQSILHDMQKSNKNSKNTKNTKNNNSNEVNIRKTQSLIEKDDDIQPNTTEAQERFAVAYKKNKKNVLNKFKGFDRNNKGYVNMKGFYDVAKVFDIQQTIAKQIFMNNVTNGNEFRYEQWLDEISEMYAQDIQPQNQQQQNNNTKQQQNQKHYSQDEDHKEDQPEPQPQPQPKKEANKNNKMKQSKKEQTKNTANMDLISNLIPMLKKQQEQNKEAKRGENLEAFDVLKSLIQVQGNKTDKGYKLIDFIADQQGQIEKKRQQMLQKSQKVRSSSQKFKDKDFPPTQSSISQDKESGIKNSNLLQWKHYSEIYKKPQLFKGSVQPNDIRQGQLGDCYFLSSLAGLAQYRNLVQRLFQYFDMDNGYFLVWLCIDGEWELVEVDGYLPVWPNGDKPAFSHSSQEEIWVSILEKAYAKSYGSYKRIIGGQPFEAIKDLTGSPGLQYLFSKFTKDQIWQKLVQSNKNQYIMAAGTKVEQLTGKLDGHDQNVSKNGIVLGHAYSILDCQQVNKERILKLRNPWGQFEWSGDQWSDKGKKWTPQMKKKLNHEINQNDGIFWITLQQFYINFMSISINQIKPNYYYRATQNQGIQQILVRLNVRQFNHGYLMVCHKDHRHKGLPINTPYGGIYSLLPFIQNDGKIVEKFQEKKFLYQREGYVEFRDVGKYGEGCQAMVLVNLFQTTDVTIGYYGDKATNFQIHTQCSNLIQKLAYMDQNSPKTQTHQNTLKIWQSSIQGTIFLCFKNLQKDPLKLTVTIKNPQNIRIMKPFDIENKLNIKSGEIQSIRMKIIGNPYSYSYGISS